MNIKARLWLFGWLLLVCAALGSVAYRVYRVDPYFHYHKPDTENYFYALTLDNERNLNNGISKHFTYDALITGTSLTENFKASEMDAVFGVNAVKVCYSGASYKEINDNLKIALSHNEALKTIVRGLDMHKFFDEASAMNQEEYQYPTYLYDDNPLNDVYYLFNRDTIFSTVYPMTVENDEDGFAPGITSFDDYARWQSWFTFGVNTVCPDGIAYDGLGEAVHLTDEERRTIEENITQNVTSLADAYPDVDFYYFFTPNSIAWWEALACDGTIYRQVEAEELIISLILEHENIHLYSFNNRTDITTDLNNYKDTIHYAEWINSLILRWMREGSYLLTKENYKTYLADELNFYTAYDYNSINGQTDYPNDAYAAALLHGELSGAAAIRVLEDWREDLILSASSAVIEDEDGSAVLRCVGTLERGSDNQQTTAEYMLGGDYAGARFELADAADYAYLVFYGRKVNDHGQPTVCVYDAQGQLAAEIALDCTTLDSQWYQYMIDITELEGPITMIFNGGYPYSFGSAESEYWFKGIVVY